MIVASANCSSTQLTLALKPLHEAFGLHSASVVTMQAISGAGYPGIPSQDILGNVIPLIGGEEAKVESEPLKLLGTLNDNQIALAPITMSAQCNRVPVRDGHTECVSAKLRRPANDQEMLDAWRSFRATDDVLDLPSTPDQAIVIHEEPDRPQPGRDLDTGNGMSIVVGRLRPCPILDFKFVVLGHNTVRGAAGGAIHNAELLRSQGWLD
jgi:aspartate-semialdehyde dehydrogenase